MVSLSLSDEIIKSLSRNELNILRYVYEHTDDILEESIQEFSRQVSYSPATVLRFCKKLGYSGFAELKYVLRSSRQKSEKNDLSSDKKADSEGGGILPDSEQEEIMPDTGDVTKAHWAILIMTAALCLIIGPAAVRIHAFRA